MTPASNMTGRVARWLVRVYPRAWRERYADEMRALLAETTVTPAVMLDLIAGAVREWIRACTRQPESPVSLDREIWRGWRRSLIGAVLIAGVSWELTRVFFLVGILPHDDPWFLSVGVLYSVTRVLVVQIRCMRLRNRALKASLPLPMLAAVGIGRVEFWMGVALLTVATTTTWSNAQGFGWWIKWFSLWLYLDVLRNSTRTVLARRDMVMQLAIAERQATQVPPGQ